MVRLRFPGALLASGALVLTMGGAARLAAQEPAAAGPPPVIDTVIVQRNNVFTEKEAAGSGMFRLMNRIHVVTAEGLIRDYLQFTAGDTYDSASVTESERHLREERLFRDVQVDSVRLEDGRLAVRVRTRDAWTLKPKLQFSVASTGDWTGTLGINETNLLGTGNQVYVAYAKEVDRDGLNTTVDMERMFRSEIDLLLNYAGLSDGKNGNWVLGRPFRNEESVQSYEWDGSGANQDVFRYRVEDRAGESVLDTTVYRRKAFVNNLTAALATRHEAQGYLRWGATAGVRSETFHLASDTADAAQDSVYGTLEAWSEISKVRFQQLRQFNGFGAEDIDLSPRLRISTTLAPDGLGWQGTGVGLGVKAELGRAGLGGRGWVWSSIAGNYQWGGAARDSGRVVFSVAAAYKPAPRHATAAQFQFGRLWNAKPGDEFDLGFDSAPRGWPAHSFVGDRMWWATIEHRYYVVDKFLGIVGVGLGAFVDYGGAWYGNQEPRTGGSAGLGLRLGSALSAVAMTTRLDAAYNFGGTANGSRWTFTIGSGFVFPVRDPPTISYTAEAPL